MSAPGENDLSRIVNLIMNNPKLVEEISNLASSSEGEKEESDNTAEIQESTPASVSDFKDYGAMSSGIQSGNGNKRSLLLSALKPYISSERARAIDSMVSVMNMLDIMKSK